MERIVEAARRVIEQRLPKPLELLKVYTKMVDGEEVVCIEICAHLKILIIDPDEVLTGYIELSWNDIEKIESTPYYTQSILASIIKSAVYYSITDRLMKMIGIKDEDGDDFLDDLAYLEDHMWSRA